MWEFMATRPHEATVPQDTSISLATLCARPHLLSPPPADPRAQGSQGSHWPKGLSKHAMELADPSWLGGDAEPADGHMGPGGSAFPLGQGSLPFVSTGLGFESQAPCFLAVSSWVSLFASLT